MSENIVHYLDVEQWTATLFCMGVIF